MSWLLVFVSIVGAAPMESSPAQLSIPQSNAVVLQLHVRFGEATSDQAWSSFMDHWFTFFDLDRNGTIDPTEAERIPALINQAGRAIRPSLKSADMNGDGTISPQEMGTYYRASGITGIQLADATNDAAAIQASDALWHKLDLNQDGLLSPSELKRAPQILNQLDLNEDERLSFNELPGLQTEALPQSKVVWLRDHKQSVDMAKSVPLTMNLDSLDHPAARVPSVNCDEKISVSQGQQLRMVVNETAITFRLHEGLSRQVGAAKQYLMGELNASLNGKPQISLEQAQADPSLEWLTPLFPVAGRDQQLGDSELKAFVDLLAEGAAAQLSIAVSIRGNNLFDWLDTNSDHVLDLQELAIAHRRVTSEQNTVSKADVPLSLHVTVRRGPVSGRFGRLRISQRQIDVADTPAPITPPRWFAAMDRNQDQLLSPSEFSGTLAQFQSLDRNQDSVISIDEIAEKTPP